MEKEIVKVNIGKNKIIELIIEKGSRNKKTIEMVKKGAQMALDYFDSVKDFRFKVELIYSRDEFNEKMGRKTESWLIGNSFGKRFIIFSPEKIEQHTSHKRNEFVPLIAHETTHILHEKINVNFSHWLSEGIAQYVANQEKKNHVDPKNIAHFFRYNLFKNSNYHKFISKQGYEISNKLVKFLVEHYEKKQVMSLLKIRYDFKKSSEENFCRILNIKKGDLIKKFREILMK